MYNLILLDQFSLKYLINKSLSQKSNSFYFSFFIFLKSLQILISKTIEQIIKDFVYLEDSICE